MPSPTAGSASSLTNVIRKAVSQKRNRFQDGRFDLDLTYITKEIIAMGLPASGVHSLYRNTARDVANMLNHYHNGKYVN
jgi:phosphatidylinositol-3,4,5-trisphosphate 3-phosphatase/dual-specificity protein phosphatase PTEN